MKKIIIYLATMLLAAMTFTGCYDLETYPGDKVNEGTFYKTGDHAHQGLMGIYGMLRLNEAYGYQFCFDHLGDIAYGYNYYMMFLATYTDRDGTIQAHWQTFYDGIHRVNTFIRSVKGMRGIITDEQINEYVAEAKFLRAMFYFSLTDLFGGVPYYDESTNVNEEFMNLKQPRSSLEEVRAHILEDLDEAIIIQLHASALASASLLHKWFTAVSFIYSGSWSTCSRAAPMSRTSSLPKVSTRSQISSSSGVRFTGFTAVPPHGRLSRGRWGSPPSPQIRP